MSLGRRWVTKYHVIRNPIPVTKYYFINKWWTTRYHVIRSWGGSPNVVSLGKEWVTTKHNVMREGLGPNVIRKGVGQQMLCAIGGWFFLALKNCWHFFTYLSTKPRKWDWITWQKPFLVLIGSNYCIIVYLFPHLPKRPFQVYMGFLYEGH